MVIKLGTVFVCTLVFLFVQLQAHAQEKELEVAHKTMIDGVTYRYEGTQQLNIDSEFGPRVVPNAQTAIILEKNGREVSRAVSTIGPDKFRISSATHKSGKVKHLLLIDSSVVFGDKLNDDETIAHRINERSQVYEAYPVAFPARSPQQTWLEFHEGRLPMVVREKVGRAILFTHEDDLKRYFGAVNHLLFSYNHPFLVEKSPGNFEVGGRFDKNGNLLQNLVINYCLRFIFCQDLLPRLVFFDLSPNQYRTIGRLFDSIEKMYREQFLVEDITYVWLGDKVSRENFSKYTGRSTLQLPMINCLPNGHPSAKGTQEIADFLFALNLVN